MAAKTPALRRRREILARTGGPGFSGSPDNRISMALPRLSVGSELRNRGLLKEEKSSLSLFFVFKKKG